MVEHVHWHRVDLHDFARVVLEDDYHVEVLEREAHALEVNELHLVQSDHEWRL